MEKHKLTRNFGQPATSESLPDLVDSDDKLESEKVTIEKVEDEILVENAGLAKHEDITVDDELLEPWRIAS